MKIHARCRCLHCKAFFRPNSKNRWHQKFCSAPACRQASKAASQRRWLSKPENKNYFRGPSNVERVRQWREQHPGYWRRKRGKSSQTLQDLEKSQPVDNKGVKPVEPGVALQDFVPSQHPLIVGLISFLTGHALQEDIDRSLQKLLSRGQTILGMVPGNNPKGNCNDDNQTSSLFPTAAAHSGPV